MQDFIHINVHSHYSINKSILTIPEAVDKAVEDGMKGIALTDIGVMYGIKEFVDYCAKINKKRAKDGLEPFKPIIGCELYVAPRTMHDKEKGDEKCGRLIVLAKNLTGYRNLCRLVSNSWTEGLMYETPRTDHAELEKYKEGLIVIVSGMNSEIANYAIAGDMDKALFVGEWYKTTFGDDFYLGIKRNETLFKSETPNADNMLKKVWSAYIKIDTEYNLKSVCVNSCNYLNEEDGVVLDHLLAIANNTTLDDAACPRHIEGEWMMTREELAPLFRGRTDARINSLELFDKVEFYSIESFPLLPYFSIPESFGTEEEWRHRYSDEQIRKEFICDENGNNPLDEYDASMKINQLGGIDELYRIKFQSDYLSKLAYDGAKRIYGTLTPEIEERLRFELHIIKIIGFPSYFLFVQDYVNAAQKELNVWVGPGRGSAVGSIVNYCLGITKIDPLKHGLLFERFLNPDRISLPDIDLDFDVDGRGKIIQWIKEKYGEENCANIVTFGTMSARNAINAVGRIEKLSLEKANALCCAIPNQYYGKNILKQAIANKDSEGKPENPMLVAALNSNDPKEANTVKYASQLEGIVRGTGIHACGLIISHDAIANYVPVAVDEDPDFPEKKTLVTQYDGHVIESTGLVKFDFLGLWTLTEMKECICLIKQNRGIDVDIDNIPLDDEKTFKLYQEGRTTGTFQFESPGMQKYLQQLQPTTLDDLVALNALYRPGPMDFIPSLIARKNGKQPISYDLPVMESYLNETYGITVYQEQIMCLARAIAGFTRGESDALRKALGRQYYPILKAFKEMFIAGGEKNGYNPDILEKTWCNWEMFGKYAFNKAHALAYTLIAYQTAYLKAHYPEEYMSALIQRRQHDDNEVTRLMEECKRMDIKSLSANVNDVYQVFLTPNTDESIDNYSTYDGTICPHCGNKIEKFDHYCYYSWDGGKWSDLRHKAPQVMVPSLVQLCPNCGNHFAMNNENMMLNDTSMVNFVDPVDFPALIHGALRYCMPMSEFEWDSPEQEFNQRMRFLWAYNDYFYRNKSEHPEPDDMAKLMHHHNIMELQKFIESPLMQCDLLRQAGDFDECLSQIDALMPQAPEDAVSILKLLKQKVLLDDKAPFEMNEQYKGELSVKVTCTGCFSGVGKPEIFIEGTPQFLFWLDIFKEGLQKPISTGYTDVKLYRGDELIGSVRGDLNQRQSQRLCKLQRETDDCCGYSGMIRTPEEWEEISHRHANNENSESKSLFDVNDSSNSSEDGNDDLPF